MLLVVQLENWLIWNCTNLAHHHHSGTDRHPSGRLVTTRPVEQDCNLVIVLTDCLQAASPIHHWASWYIKCQLHYGLIQFVPLIFIHSHRGYPTALHRFTITHQQRTVCQGSQWPNQVWSARWKAWKEEKGKQFNWSKLSNNDGSELKPVVRPRVTLLGIITSLGWAFLHSTCKRTKVEHNQQLGSRGRTILLLISWKCTSHTLSTTSSFSKVTKPNPVGTTNKQTHQ